MEAHPATPVGPTEEIRKRLEEILAEREIDYWDIVWGQFKKSRISVFGLLVILVLFALAIFAPLLACHVPFSYFEDGRLDSPWYRYLLNMDSSVDHVFNMSMLLALPWGLGVLAGRRVGGGGSGRRLLAVHGLPFLVVFATAAVFAAASSLGSAEAGARPGIVLQLGFVIALAWLGQGVVRWRMRYGRKTAKRQLLLQISTFLCALAVASAAFRPSKIPGTERHNPLHPIYDGTDIRREEYFQSPEFEGRGFWPLIRHSYLDQDRAHANAHPPQHGHLLGTNANGYDILSQLLYGGRTALTIGFVGVAIYMVIGTILGALAGYFGGWVDIMISRFIEIMICFPSFFLILVVVGLLQDQAQLREYLPPIFLIMIVIGVVSWTHEARLIRGEFLRLRNQDFVVAARALGVSNLRIIFRHIMPNAIAPALVAATFGIGGAILTEGALSFLGIGINPPIPSWGKMLRDGYDAKFLYLLTPPAIMFFITVTAYNLVGEGLRDSLDPRLRK